MLISLSLKSMLNINNKISYFTKIVGIFLDLDEQFIVKLIAEDKYFADQVIETVRVIFFVNL